MTPDLAYIGRLNRLDRLRAVACRLVSVDLKRARRAAGIDAALALVGRAKRRAALAYRLCCAAAAAAAALEEYLVRCRHRRQVMGGGDWRN